MITPQHYLVRGLYRIHPDVLDEACAQGRYVTKHFAYTIIFVVMVWAVASYTMYIQEDVWRGVLMMVWGGVIAILYMYIVLQNLPTIPLTPSPDPGMLYKIMTSQKTAGLFILTNILIYCSIYSVYTHKEKKMFPWIPWDGLGILILCIVTVSVLYSLLIMYSQYKDCFPKMEFVKNYPAATISPAGILICLLLWWMQWSIASAVVLVLVVLFTYWQHQMSAFTSEDKE